MREVSVRRLVEYLVKVLFQFLSVILRQRVVVGLDEIMEQGSVRAQGGTNCDDGKIKLFDWTGCDGCCDWGLLPFQVRVTNEITCYCKPTHNYHGPNTFPGFCLKMTLKVAASLF